ncbi:MAG: c-type cytochrome [Steroidobacteraceae bacterium]
MRSLSYLPAFLVALLASAHALASPATNALAEYRAAAAAVPDARRGDQIFATCAACHGVDGSGLPDGSVPVIGSQHYPVLLRQLVDYRHAERWDIRMEHVSRLKVMQTPQDLADVAALIASLQPMGPTVHGSGEFLASGARVYFERCQTCHGATGQGNADRGIARLAGQHPEYLIRQFIDVVEGRRPRLSKTHAPLMRELQRTELEGIADYLSRTRRPRGDVAP